MISQNLNDDVLLEIALNSDINTISNLCRTNAKYNRLLCNNQNFWHERFIRDYFDIPNYTGDWRQLYLNYGRLYTVRADKRREFFYPKPITRAENFKPKQIDKRIAVDSEGSVWIYKSGSGHYDVIAYGEGWIRLPGIRAKMACTNCIEIMYIDYNDDVYFYGRKEYDAFFKSKKRYSPTESVLVPGIKARQISLGYNRAAIIDKQGSVYVLGFSGLGSFEKTESPTKIPNIVAKQVYLGGHEAAIIDINDELYVFGYNIVGSNPNANTPQRLHGFRAKDVTLTPSVFFFIDLENNLWGARHILGTSNLFTEPQDTGIKCNRVFVLGDSMLIVDLDDNLYSIGGFPDILDKQRKPPELLLSNIKVQNLDIDYYGGWIFHVIGTMIKD